MKRYADWVSKGFENEAGMIDHEAGLYVLHSEAQERIDALTAERDALLKDMDALRNLATCECGDEFTAHDKGTCGNCKCAESIPQDIPEGYVMVPVDPTDDMQDFGREALRDCGVDRATWNATCQCYKAMIAASQKGGEA